MGCATGVDLVPESTRGVPYVSSKRSFCSIVSDHPCSLLRKRTVAAVTVDAGLGRSMAEEGTQNVGVEHGPFLGRHGIQSINIGNSSLEQLGASRGGIGEVLGLAMLECLG